MIATRPLSLATLLLVLAATLTSGAAGTQPYRYVAGLGAEAEGHTLGACMGSFGLVNPFTPVVAGVCAEVEPGTYRIVVVDDVHGPVGFYAFGNRPGEPTVEVGPLVILRERDDCGVNVHAHGSAIVTIPQGCNLDVYVELGAVTGRILLTRL